MEFMRINSKTPKEELLSRARGTALKMLVLKDIAQVITMAGGPAPRCGAGMRELGILRNGAVIIRGGRIAWVGPSQDLPVELSNGACLELSGGGKGCRAGERERAEERQPFDRRRQRAATGAAPFDLGTG